MKRIIIFATTFVLFATTACMSDKMETSTPESEKSDNYVEFTASTNLTKTSFDKANNYFVWNPGDKISVYDNTSKKGIEFPTDIKENSSTATFKGNATPVNSKYHAIYPSVIDKKPIEWISENKAVISITNQQVARKNFTPSNVPNVTYASCSTDNTNLVFHNCLAYLRFNIANTGGLKNVVVMSNDQTQLTGSATLDFMENTSKLNGDKYKFSAILNGGTYGITRGGDYYVAVLPGYHAKGLVVKCIKQDNTNVPKDIPEALTIEAGKIYNLGTIY